MVVLSALATASPRWRPNPRATRCEKEVVSMSPTYPTPEEAVAEMILNAKKVVVFTGAGVSTDSGIPDFRSPGGYWEKYQPLMYHDFLTSAEARKEQWRRSTERYLAFAEGKPNAAHPAVAQLERIGTLAFA